MKKNKTKTKCKATARVIYTWNLSWSISCFCCQVFTDMQDLLELRQHPVIVGPLPEHLSTAGADEVNWNPGKEAWGHRLELNFGPAGEFEGLGVQGSEWGPAAMRGELWALWGPPAIVIFLCFILRFAVIPLRYDVLKKTFQKKEKNQQSSKHAILLFTCC